MAGQSNALPQTSTSGDISLRTDLIVAFFALLGLIGSVVIFKTASAPPIIVAVFLATGVSALVYRFLGGIQGASFALGTLKLTGTAAALIAIAFSVNRYLEAQTLDVVAIEGKYDWQWAQGGWTGFFKIDKDGTVLVNMNKILNCDGEQVYRPLLRQIEKGTIVETGDRSKIRVNIPVQFANYDEKCNQTGFQSTTTLVGDLTRRAAFGGQIEYQNEGGSSLGGILIIKNN